MGVRVVGWGQGRGSKRRTAVEWACTSVCKPPHTHPPLPSPPTYSHPALTRVDGQLGVAGGGAHVGDAVHGAGAVGDDQGGAGVRLSLSQRLDHLQKSCGAAGLVSGAPVSRLAGSGWKAGENHQCAAVGGRQVHGARGMRCQWRRQSFAPRRAPGCSWPPATQRQRRHRGTGNTGEGEGPSIVRQGNELHLQLQAPPILTCPLSFRWPGTHRLHHHERQLLLGPRLAARRKLHHRAQRGGLGLRGKQVGGG